MLWCLKMAKKEKKEELDEEPTEEIKEENLDEEPEEEIEKESVENESIEEIKEENEEDVKSERERLSSLGVSNTWNILTSADKDKKKKEPEKKPAFRGFK